jgi:glucose-1-phosphate adenylyltransferase
MNQTLMMVLAGGKGARLAPLTCHRAKPAVPFAGRYRIVDFVLSNVVNSGYRRVYVLTQFMASSLIKHLSRTWHLAGSQEFIEVVPAQMRLGDHWYRGTADAVWQNANLIRDSRADVVGIFGGDHIYKFSIDQMEAEHRAQEADLTVAAISVPREEAHQFGVIEVDADGWITGFEEKPADPKPRPDDPTRCLVSMGNYFFRRTVLMDALRRDADDTHGAHDFGRDVVPGLVRSGRRVRVYDFGTNRLPGEREGSSPYWRDVGTIDSLFQANMEVGSPAPGVNLYNRLWRIRTAQRDYPPARLLPNLGTGDAAQARESLLCEGSIVAGSRLEGVLLGYDSYVHSDCWLDRCVVFSGCDIGAGALLRRVMLDKNVTLEPGVVIGHDAADDRARFPFISPEGVVVLPKGTTVPKKGPIRIAADLADVLARDKDTAAALAVWRGDLATDRGGVLSFASRGPGYTGPT